jgi:hypothetical protein
MPDPTSWTEPSPSGNPFHIRSYGQVHLGPLLLEIRCNEPHFSGFRYFPDRVTRVPTSGGRGASPDYSLNLCNITVDGPWPVQTLAELRDGGYRARRFAMGYYLTDHFGAPAYLMTRGREYWIFAEDFEPILWPYLAKALLTFYSMEHGLLHLKAATVAIEGNGTLLIARGGGGKTVLLAHLCRCGAEFLSNTHTLIDQDAAIAIPTAMRVRNDRLFGPLIAANHLTRGLKPDEYMADPLTHMRWKCASTAPVRNVCLVDYRGPNTRIIREMDRTTLLDYMDQFSLALNVYGLKEDVLDHLSANVTQFSDKVSEMRTQLRDLLDRSRTYYVSLDAEDAPTLQSLYQLLAGRAS